MRAVCVAHCTLRTNLPHFCQEENYLYRLASSLVHHVSLG
jgi:hypothetical protein